MVDRLASGLKRIYEDIGRDVGLTDAESEALIRLIAEQQLRLSDANIQFTVPGVDAYNDIKAQFQREIEQQIGIERSHKLARYQYSLNARFEVEEARREPEIASLPLTEWQRESFIRAAIDRGAFVREPTFIGGESLVAHLQQALAHIDLRDQKLLEVARGILNLQQFEHYEAYVISRRATFDDSLRRAEAQAAAR